MHVEVEHRLPRRPPQPFIRFTPSAQAVLSPARQALGGERHRGEVVAVDLVEVLGMVARHHQRVPAGAGLMSMNATVRSSSATICEGSSPAMILQNRQSGSDTASSLGAAAELVGD